MRDMKNRILFDSIAKYSTKQLLDLWDESEKQMMSLNLADVREAIMDTLKVRHPKEYQKWEYSEHPNDNIHNYIKGEST